MEENANQQGRLEIPVVADLAPFVRQAQQELRQRANEAGRSAAGALTAAMSEGLKAGSSRVMSEYAKMSTDELRTALQHSDIGGVAKQAITQEMERRGIDIAAAMRKQGEKAGKAMGEGVSDGLKDEATKTVDDFLRAIEQGFRVARADATEELANKLIDPKKLEARVKDAAVRANDAIAREIKRRAQAGTLTQAEFVQLTEAMRKEGLRGGKAFRSGAQDEMQKFERWMRGAFALGFIGAVMYAINRAVSAVRDGARRMREIIERGSDITTAREGFGQLAQRRGLSPEATLAALRRGTLGQIDAYNLLRQANVALLSDLELTENGLERMITVSRRLGQTVGKDATESFEYFIRAIVTGQSDMLKQLGLTTTLEGALRKWRQETGRSTDTLSEQQRIMILFNDVMEESERKVAALGTETITAGHHIGRFVTNTKDLSDAIKQAVSESPPLIAFLDSIANSADGAAGRVERLADWIGALLDTWGQNPVVRAALGVTSLQIRSQVSAIAAIASGGDSDGIQRNFDRRQFTRSQVRMREEFAADDDLPFLREARDLINQRIQAEHDLTQELRQRKGTEAEEDLAHERRNEMLKTRTVLLQRITELEAGDDGGGGPTPIDPEELKRLEKLVEDFRRSQLSDAARQLEDLRAVQAAARTTGNTAVLEQLEQPIRNAQREVNRINRLFGEMPALIARIKPAVEDSMRTPLLTVSVDARTQLDIYQRAFQQTMTQLREDLARGVISDRDFEAREKEAIERLNGKILELLDTLRDLGLLTPQFHQLLVGALQGANEEGDDLAENLKTVAGFARGILSTADAVGKIGENARKSLQGIVDIVEGIQAMRDATTLAGQLGAGATIAGGALSLLSGLLGDSPERREALRRNTQALEDMTLALRGFRATDEAVRSARSAIEEALDTPGRDSRSPTNRSRARAEMERVLMEALTRGGLGMAELRSLAEEHGIDLFDKNGRIVAARLEELADRLALVSEGMTKFANTVDDQRTSMEMEADINDETNDSAARLQREFDLLAKFAPELVKQFMAGADPSTPEGQAAIEQGVRAMFAAFQAGTLDLGGMTREEFLAILRALEASLDELGVEGGVTSGARAQTRLAVNITEVQADRMLSQLSTQTYYLSRIAGVIAGPSGFPIGSSLPAPNPQAFGLGGTTTIGTIEVEAIFPNVTGEITPERGRAVGAAIGDGLRQRISASHHAAGAQGAPRVVVATRGA